MYYCDEREKLSIKLEVVKAAQVELFKNDSTQSERLAAIREINELEGAIDCIAPRYQVGDGISCCGYSDVAPYTVIDVSSSGKRITVRACKAELDPSWKPKMHVGGFSAHTSNNAEQKWIITEDEEGAIRELSLRKSKVNNAHVSHRESWRRVGESTQGGSRWYDGRRKFYDYNF